MKKIFISDIDDTIACNGERPTKYFLEELNSLIKNGAYFALNTARSYEYVKDIFNDINVPVISRSGTIIYDKNGSIIKKNTIRKAEQIIKKVLVCNVPFVICVVNKNKEEFYTSVANSDTIISMEPKVKIVSDRKLLSLKGVVSIYIFSNKKININNNKILLRNFCNFYQITDIKSTKSISMLWLKRKYNFDYTISFGDDENDYSMLDESDEAYLVRNKKSSMDDDKKYRYINFDNGRTIVSIMKSNMRKKILMVPSGYYPECNGGVEVITQALSEGLVKKGYEIVVMCQSNRNCEEYINGVHIYRVKPHDISNKNNIRIIYKLNRLLQMYNPFNKKHMSNIIKKEKPDIVHVHMVRTLSMSLFEVVNKLDIPIISTLHEYFSLWNFDPFGEMKDMLITKPQWYVQLIRKKHKKLTAKTKIITAPLIRTINEYQKEGYYRNVEGVEILNSLPPIENGKRKKILEKKKNRHLNNESEKVQFLIISRLMPFKGIKESVEAFMKLKNKNIVLNIAGDGELKQYIIDCTKKDSRIKYHGYVCGKEKENLFMENDVLIFPTTELETYGLVIIEAYNYSMPVITSNVEATKRLVSNNKTGTIIKNVNEKELCAAMKKYTEKEILFKEANNCYQYIKEKDYDNFINNYINIYERI